MLKPLNTSPPSAELSAYKGARTKCALLPTHTLVCFPTQPANQLLNTPVITGLHFEANISVGYTKNGYQE